jgi:hypothetical protein
MTDLHHLYVQDARRPSSAGLMGKSTAYLTSALGKVDDLVGEILRLK